MARTTTPPRPSPEMLVLAWVGGIASLPVPKGRGGERSTVNCTKTSILDHTARHRYCTRHYTVRRCTYSLWGRRVRSLAVRKQDPVQPSSVSMPPAMKIIVTGQNGMAFTLDSLWHARRPHHPGPPRKCWFWPGWGVSPHYPCQRAGGGSSKVNCTKTSILDHTARHRYSRRHYTLRRCTYCTVMQYRWIMRSTGQVRSDMTGAQAGNER